jgi:RNA polymerase sigma-70 factor (ECF subfamily)
MPSIEFHPRGLVARYNPVTMMTTDRELMDRVARSDEGAFTDLANRYTSRLMSLAWRLLGNRADAEDAVQRSLLRCYTSAKSYRSDWAVSTWLYRITTNVCVDEMRRRQSRSSLQKAAAEEAGDGQGLLFPAHGRPAGLAQGLDVQKALERVPREARILLALCYVDGLSYAELARVRGISVNTVKSQLARGKTILRATLTESQRRREPAVRTAKGATES